LIVQQIKIDPAWAAAAAVEAAAAACRCALNPKTLAERTTITAAVLAAAATV
jgi:hypothetical protein